MDGDSVNKSYRRFWVHSPYQFLVVRYSEVASEVILGKTATGILSQALSVCFFFTYKIVIHFISTCHISHPVGVMNQLDIWAYTAQIVQKRKTILSSVCPNIGLVYHNYCYYDPQVVHGVMKLCIASIVPFPAQMFCAHSVALPKKKNRV